MSLNVMCDIKADKTNVYSVQLGEEPNLRLQIGITLRVEEGVIDLPPP